MRVKVSKTPEIAVKRWQRMKNARMFNISINILQNISLFDNIFCTKATRGRNRIKLSVSLKLNLQ